jgi:O-antigen ligase
VNTVDNRVQFWQAAWNAIQQSDFYHVLIGYGAYGQLTSGASRNYGSAFEGVTAEPLLDTVHDLPLQTMLDGGVLALIALVFLGIAAFVSLGRVVVADKGVSPPIQALLAILILFLLNGATEALPSYLFPESLDIVLLVSGAAVALSPSALVEPARERSRVSIVRSGVVPGLRPVSSHEP